MKAIKASRLTISYEAFPKVRSAIQNTLWMRANAYDQSHPTEPQRARPSKLRTVVVR